MTRCFQIDAFSSDQDVQSSTLTATVPYTEIQPTIVSATSLTSSAYGGEYSVVYTGGVDASLANLAVWTDLDPDHLYPGYRRDSNWSNGAESPTSTESGGVYTVTATFSVWTDGSSDTELQILAPYAEPSGTMTITPPADTMPDVPTLTSMTADGSLYTDINFTADESDSGVYFYAEVGGHVTQIGDQWMYEEYPGETLIWANFTSTAIPNTEIPSNSTIFAVGAWFDEDNVPADHSAYSNSLSIGAGAGGVIPNAAANLSADAVDGNDVILHWQDNSDNEDSFEIDLNVGGNDWVSLGTVGADALTDDISLSQIQSALDDDSATVYGQTFGILSVDQSATSRATDPDQGPPPGFVLSRGSLTSNAKGTTGNFAQLWSFDLTGAAVANDGTPIVIIQQFTAERVVYSTDFSEYKAGAPAWLTGPMKDVYEKAAKASQAVEAQQYSYYEVIGEIPPGGSHITTIGTADELKSVFKNGAVVVPDGGPHQYDDDWSQSPGSNPRYNAGSVLMSGHVTAFDLTPALLQALLDANDAGHTTDQETAQFNAIAGFATANVSGGLVIVQAAPAKLPWAGMTPIVEESGSQLLYYNWNINTGQQTILFDPKPVPVQP